jgi:hypothetical protein
MPDQSPDVERKFPVGSSVSRNDAIEENRASVITFSDPRVRQPVRNTVSKPRLEEKALPEIKVDAVREPVGARPAAQGSNLEIPSGEVSHSLSAISREQDLIDRISEDPVAAARETFADG